MAGSLRATASARWEIARHRSLRVDQLAGRMGSQPNLFRDEGGAVQLFASDPRLPALVSALRPLVGRVLERALVVIEPR